MPSRTDEKEEEDREEEIDVFLRKGKEKKKPGRKTCWSSAAINDFINIVVNDNVYKRRLLFFNTHKKWKNGELYKTILNDFERFL